MVYPLHQECHHLMLMTLIFCCPGVMADFTVIIISLGSGSNLILMILSRITIMLLMND